MSKRSWLQLGMMGLLTGVMGCQSLALNLPLLSETAPIPIASVESQPGATVYVQGIVRDRAPLINGLIYQLQDDTGEIWVVTTDTQVELGDRLWIEAQVQYEAITVESQDWGEVYLQEIQQLHQDSEAPPAS